MSQNQQQQSQSEKFFWRKNPTEGQGKESNATPSAKPAEPANPLNSILPPKAELRSKTIVGIPCHNAELTVAKMIAKLSSLDAEILVCDDGSTDLTEDIALKMGCRVIKHPRELGRSDAITSLFLAAKRLRAESLLTVSIDSPFTAADANKLLDSVRKGDADVAIGSRYSIDSIAEAHNEGTIRDRETLLRAYGKKALAMISPPGTNSVVIEKEILEFADQQGLKVREFPTSVSSPENDSALLLSSKKKNSTQSLNHFEERFMNFVSVKHPLVFFGIPSIGFLYISVFETLEASNLSQISIGGLAKFGMNFVASPFFLISIAFSIGSALLFSLKHLGKLSGQEK